MTSRKAAGATGAVVLLLAAVSAAVASPASAAQCLGGTPVPQNSYPGIVVAATNFESDSLSPFIAAQQGTGTPSVSEADASSGECAAQLHVTADRGSLANLSVPLPAQTETAFADGWFNITTAGVRGNNVPYFRFFSGATRIADVYRNNSNGQLWLRTTTPDGPFVFTRLATETVTLDDWHRVTVRLSPDGDASKIQVWFDGKLLHSSSNTKNTGVTTVDRVQIGAEHVRQMGDSQIDDVVIKAVPAQVVKVAEVPRSKLASAIALLTRR